MREPFCYYVTTPVIFSLAIYLNLFSLNLHKLLLNNQILGLKHHVANYSNNSVVQYFGSCTFFYTL